jgi:hypothetical protein
MEPERFVEAEEQSLYGECLYDQIVPQEHFLRKLQQIIEWKRFTIGHCSVRIPHSPSRLA